MSVIKEGYVQQVIERYENDTGMLIPMMQDLQADCGYLPVDQLRRLAARLDVPLSRLYAVATFYSSFRLAPKGLYEVTLCVGTVCYLKGAGQIAERISRSSRSRRAGPLRRSWPGRWARRWRST